MEKLEALSPLDGRYANKTESLRNYFSEEALINYRIAVECEYLIFVLKNLNLSRDMRPLSANKELSLRSIYSDRENNALTVKKIEFSGMEGLPATNHDVKAVEYYLRKVLKEKGLEKYCAFLHFGLTSEDINNIAYSLMISAALKNEIIPALDKILKNLKELSVKNAAIPLLARTHGQPAVGTTFGKEFRVFYERILRKRKRLSSCKLNVKINGAVGNYNALNAAYPKIDWISFSQKFISALSRRFSAPLECNLYTTQIENHDSWIEIFTEIKHLNRITASFCRDIWRYISDELIIQIPSKGEIGSSTMPQKINPIDFENAEGNLGLACSLFSFFEEKLPESRLQRDLSDSTVQRSIGSAFGYSLIAYNSLLKGLSKIKISQENSEKSLYEHPEVYAEAVQTILRRELYPNAYEKLKDFSRGKKITMKKWKSLVSSLKISKKAKADILAILNKPYIGLAEKLAIKNLK
ncbi:MAG: adenylosuccinate lyase [Elusimicrobia bacterium]|nr:adenylosuccinate lyase [Elusimicrobiota bacterium]